MRLRPESLSPPPVRIRRCEYQQRDPVSLIFPKEKPVRGHASEDARGRQKVMLLVITFSMK
jgi:hypothetical protein